MDAILTALLLRGKVYNYTHAPFQEHIIDIT